MSSFRQLMMKKKGGGAKTLNLVSVGGATYDSDYIFTKTSADSMDMYFETPDTIFSSINADNYDNVEIILKIKFSASYNSPIRADQNYSFGLYVNSSYRIGLVLAASVNPTYSINVNQWYWLKITKNKTSENHCDYSLFVSVDGVNYSSVQIIVRTNVLNNTKLIFGKGTSSGTEYNFQGSIDFKETDIIINGQSVLWV